MIQQFIMENDLFDDNGDDEEDGLNAHPQEDGISATRSSTPILEIAGKKSAASSLALQGNGGNGLHEYMDVDTTNTNNMNYNDLNSFDDLYDDPGIDDDALIALEMEASSQYFPGPDGSAALPSSAGNARAAAAVQYQIPSVATKDTSPRPHLQQVHDENSHAAMNMNLSVGLTASQKDHLSNQGPFITLATNLPFLSRKHLSSKTPIIKSPSLQIKARTSPCSKKGWMQIRSWKDAEIGTRECWAA